MNNVVLFKIEILTFLLSFSYIIYYLSEKIFDIFKNIKNIIKPDRSHIDKKIKEFEEIKETKKTEKNKKIKKVKKKNITAKESKKIAEILKRVQINRAK